MLLIRVANGLPDRKTLLLLLAAFVCQSVLAQQTAAPFPDGAKLFADRCAKCHGVTGEGVSAAVTVAGPSLLAEHDAGEVMTAMETGPGHMPKFAEMLSVEQMHALAAYVTQQIAVIPLRPGDVGEGGRLFRHDCASCHRTAVRGGALAFTGVNAPALTDLSPAIIAGAIRWGPGPMPAFPPSELSAQQVDAIVAYVRFVQHPPNPGGHALNWYGPVAEGFVAWLVLFGCIGIVGWIEKGGEG